MAFLPLLHFVQDKFTHHSNTPIGAKPLSSAIFDRACPLEWKLPNGIRDIGTIGKAGSKKIE
jgi:hypothetical protein